MKRHLEWRRLYSELEKICSAEGISSPVGEGDYWIVDDDWGGYDHKVCVFKLAFLSRKLALDVRRLLANRHPKWSVLFQLELPEDPDVPPEGLRITSEDIKEYWNADILRAKYGSKFQW